MKKRGDIVNLYDFVFNERKTENQKQAQTESNKSIESHSKSNGIQTLLYFNNSQALSSIHSHPEEVQNIKNKESLYNNIVFNAKDEILELKKRRIELESKWKGKIQYLSRSKKYHSKLQSQLQQSLNESIVQDYKSNSMLAIWPKSKQKQHLTDDFIVRLKKDILSDKIQTLGKTIAKIYLIKFIAQLKKYDEMINFYQATKKRVIRQVFESWKDVIKQLQERQKIKETILKRIKARKFPAIELYFPEASP